MPDHSLDVLLAWRGRTVYDRAGEKLGKIGDLYLDGASDMPAYAGVRTGLLGRHESIVPLRGAEERDGDVHVPFDAALVRDAPSLDPDAALDEEEEHALDAHYGRQADRIHGTEGEDTMLRSEEEVSVGTTGEMAPAERVRLRKVLVTEDVETTVPRRREVVQLETEPAPEGAISSEDAGEPGR